MEGTPVWMPRLARHRDDVWRRERGTERTGRGIRNPFPPVYDNSTSSGFGFVFTAPLRRTNRRDCRIISEARAAGSLGLARVEAIAITEVPSYREPIIPAPQHCGETNLGEKQYVEK